MKTPEEKTIQLKSYDIMSLNQTITDLRDWVNQPYPESYATCNSHFVKVMEIIQNRRYTTVRNKIEQQDFQTGKDLSDREEAIMRVGAFLCANHSKADDEIFKYLDGRSGPTPGYAIAMEAYHGSEMDNLGDTIRRFRQSVSDLMNEIQTIIRRSDSGEAEPTRQAKGGQFITDEGGAEQQRARDTHITTVGGDRRIELIDDFCNWIDELIAYIKDPAMGREIAKSNTDSMGRQINNLAKKIWPQNNFDEIGWPYQSSDISECENLSGEGIFGVRPEHKERIIERLQQWKDLALKERAQATQHCAPAQNINIHNFQAILGNVQAENVQTGDHASIDKYSEIEKKKKGIFSRVLKFIGAIIVGIIVTVLTDILGDFGWIERVKIFISGK